MSVIHAHRLRYSNAYLVVGARPILVDTGSRGDAARIAAGCAAAGVQIRDLALLLHTHKDRTVNGTFAIDGRATAGP